MLIRRRFPDALAATLLWVALPTVAGCDRANVGEPAPAAKAAADTPAPSETASAARTPSGERPAAPGDAPALSWVVPATWQQIPNPNPMRLATYRIGPAGDQSVEMSVSRAGGTAEANLQRWVGQFEGATEPKRARKKVHGIDVMTIDVSGTFNGGGMMPGAPATPHPGWSLLGAIAQGSSGTPYFFKLVGPTARVRDAQASFDALVDSLAPR